MPGQKFYVALLLVALSTLSASSADRLGEDRREEKAVLPSVFNIVRFTNDACDADDNKNGTCYTGEECASKGGSNSGSCASGYGVCCTFESNCGSRSSENNTYFESSGSERGNCFTTVCPCSDNICQLRLDFNIFIISGPSTATITTTKTLVGRVVSDGIEASRQSQCLTDTFQVTSPGNSIPPTICGTNTGEHMYVEASDKCNDLVFQFGTTAVDTSLANRQWDIKITQYACDHELLPPPGCTQYFYGSNTAQVRSYNFGGGQHLANQNQNVCVRRERGNCRICWSAAADTDVALSGDAATPNGAVTGDACCAYGTAGTDVVGFDCLIFPNAVNVNNVISPNHICGRNAGLVTTGGTTAATVCSDRTPFSIRFLSDQYEFMMEASGPDLGFQVAYIMSASNCF